MWCVRSLCVVLVVIFCGCNFRGVWAQLDQPWSFPCDLSRVPVQPNFDTNRYLGHWNELLWVAPLNEKDYDSTDFFWILNNQTSDGVIHGHQSGRDSHSGHCFHSNVALNATDTPGVFLVTYPPRHTITRYYVMETDYETYANAYGCYEYSSDGSQCYKGRAWLWGRGASVADHIQNRVRGSWQSLCLDMVSLLKVTPVTGNECPAHK